MRLYANVVLAFILVPVYNTISIGEGGIAMNTQNLEQIFHNYADNFLQLNNSTHAEYYKWRIAKEFKPLMDTALASSDSSFAARLSEVSVFTENLINGGRVQPFSGLVQFAKQKPDAVRSLFCDLFDGEDDLSTLESRIIQFMERSEELREDLSPKNFKYKNDPHSVTAYLALYDPDRHYIFRYSSARVFAKSVGFADDWRSGFSFKPDIYYRMCDELVATMKANSALMAVDQSRFTGEIPDIDPSTLHRDPEKHILAFDIIYCCETYGLFHGKDEYND